MAKDNGDYQYISVAGSF